MKEKTDLACSRLAIQFAFAQAAIISESADV